MSLFFHLLFICFLNVIEFVLNCAWLVDLDGNRFKQRKFCFQIEGTCHLKGIVAFNLNALPVCRMFMESLDFVYGQYLAGVLEPKSGICFYRRVLLYQGF